MPRKPRSLRNFAISPKRPTSPGPPSPTFSDATHASAMNFGSGGPEKIITRANLKSSIQAFEDLMSTSAGYRAALIQLSNATAAFADAMQRCSGLKGPSYEAGTRLQAASGLHHLMGNHWHVLAETIDKTFEKPLVQHLETYRNAVHERSSSYEKVLREKSEAIRRTEMTNLNKKQRNLQSFRETLAILQRQVDDLDHLKAAHYQDILEHEEEVWDAVQGKTCIVVRSTMEVIDRVSAKASDPILEPMLQSVPDPFDSYGPPQAEDQIFTILPPLAVIANTPSTSPSPHTVTPPGPRSVDSSPGLVSPPWVPNGGGLFSESASSEWADASSPTTATPPRASSPSSSGTARARRRTTHPPVGHVFHDHTASDAESDVDAPPNMTGIGVNGISYEADMNWARLSAYGESPYAPAASDSTPRNSKLISPSPPDTNPKRELAAQES